ncbi:MAG: transposase [Alphaproteobacteria bacterium]|nr:transposase [Alphaproteobacteria bacterium]
MKPKTPNQIREEVRKKMVSKFNEEKEHLKEETIKYWNWYQEADEKARKLAHENNELKQKLEALEDWNRRLMEFMDMPEQERKQAYEQYIADKEFNSIIVEIIYLCDNVQNTDLDYDRYSSIDLGLDNLVTLVMDNEQPLLFNGRQVKSKNQYFNKRLSRLKSELGDKQRTSKQIRRLYVKRDNQMKDLFHKASRKIVNLLAENKVGNLVVGYNKGWKDSINIGRRNNQAFVAVPYERLIGYIKYKCEMCGIKVIVNEESYTSKCDALALECIDKHDEYMGKRVKRGLYQSSTGRLINADVNGAINIMRKVVGDSEYVTRIIGSGRLFRPIRVDIL